VIAAQPGRGRECSPGAGRLPPAGGSVGLHTRPAVATVTYLKFAAPQAQGFRVSGPAPAASWLLQPAGPGALLRNVRTVEVPERSPARLTPIPGGGHLVLVMCARARRLVSYGAGSQWRCACSNSRTFGKA
jgi:hypothetical protein